MAPGLGRDARLRLDDDRCRELGLHRVDWGSGEIGLYGGDGSRRAGRRGTALGSRLDGLGKRGAGRGGLPKYSRRAWRVISRRISSMTSSAWHASSTSARASSRREGRSSATIWVQRRPSSLRCRSLASITVSRPRCSPVVRLPNEQTQGLAGATIDHRDKVEGSGKRRAGQGGCTREDRSILFGSIGSREPGCPAVSRMVRIAWGPSGIVGHHDIVLSGKGRIATLSHRDLVPVIGIAEGILPRSHRLQQHIGIRRPHGRVVDAGAERPASPLSLRTLRGGASPT